MKKDLISISDLTVKEVKKIFSVATFIKKALKKGKTHTPLKGYTMAMIFEKPSLRTRVTFEVGMYQLGGHAIYLSKSDINMGKRESIYDVAKNLERWVNIAVARVFEHDSVVQLSKYASIPIINALSDLEHPCQALTDIFTLKEKWGEVKGKKLVFIGDGNNTCHSLMLLATKLGMNMVVCGPEKYRPKREIEEKSLEYAKESGGSYTFLTDPHDAVKDADAIYTDVWASMGQEHEAEERKKIFMPYQVNSELMNKAPSNVFFMHDLPAHRGEEVTDEVIDSENSIVFDQAENRLHTQKGIIVYLLNWKHIENESGYVVK